MDGMAALVCPRCGGVFQIKPRRASGRQADAASPDNTRRPDGPTAARRRAGLVWAFAGLIILLSLTLLTVTFFRRTQPAPPTGPKPFVSDEHNYSFVMPGPPWQRDADLAKRLGGVLAFHRDDLDASAVLAVRKYPKYVPAAGELREEPLTRLRKFPFKNLSPEDRPDGMLAGRHAGRFVFLGGAGDTSVSGDVQYLTHQGTGYWLYRWCPTAAVERAATDLADFADRFALLDLHPDWQPPRRTFTGEKLKYTLTAEGDRWDKASYPPANYDPAADLALVGQEREGATDPLRQAMLLVVILPPGEGDPVERAKAHLLERQKEVYEGTTLTDVAAAADGVVSMKVVNTKDRERFVLLRVIGPVMLWRSATWPDGRCGKPISANW
jgi:hypothetical protein